MIRDHVISVKWATAVNDFNIQSPEDMDTLQEFRSWYLKAKSIKEVPQPFRSWVLNGLPARYSRQEQIQKGTVTPKFSIEEIED
jgi:hypothetical protein